MTWDRVDIVERQLDRYLDSAQAVATRLEPSARCGAGAAAATALALFEDHCPRQEVAARELKRLTAASTQSARRATRTTRSSGPACASTIPPSSTIGPAASCWRARASFPAAHRSLTPCLAWSPRARTRSARAATRCGAAVRCGCRHRPAPSQATCRRRWAWPSASPAHIGSVSPAAFSATPWWSAPSATPA